MAAARRKVLFFSESVTLAHAARPMVLAGALDAARYESVLAIDPRYESLFPSSQVRRVGLQSIATEQFVEALAKGRPLYELATLESYLEQDLRIIEQERPDFIVGDFRLSLSVSARLSGVPYLAIANAYWSPLCHNDYPIPEHPLVPLLGLATAQWLFDRVRPLAFALHTLPLNRLRKRHGLHPLGYDLRRTYTDCDHLLYADIPGLVPMARLPGNHHFLGPVLWAPRIDYPQWWDALDAARPIIYISPGSSGSGAMLQVLIGALSELPVTLVIATAGARIVSTDRPNVFSADYLPGDELAARAALVICNGGSLMCYQALAEGVPVIGIAGNLDQHLNISAIERLGAGVRLRSDRLDSAGLRGAVERLLRSDTARAAAGALQTRIGSMNPAVELQKLLDRF
ncbi:MAG: glycosyltransferase [Gammaproteobacteria bacterium]|nr:glycosyltransferase [Gammaproteobacteria bacterium]